MILFLFFSCFYLQLSLLNGGTLTGESLPVPCADAGEGSAENADEVEAILLEHLQSGNRAALFPLGQFYYEQVAKSFD